MSERPPVIGAVLCGGASARMGTDKARLQVGERSLLQAALDALTPLADDVVLATGRRPRYEETGYTIVLDPQVGDGPLAGLAAALEHAAQRSPKGWLVTLACDMPRVRTDVLSVLLDRAQAEDLDVCLLATDGGLEPLCCVYRTTCLVPVTRALARGERRLIAFHEDDLRVGTVHESELSPSQRGSAMNLNTPEQLATARRTA